MMAEVFWREADVTRWLEEIVGHPVQSPWRLLKPEGVAPKLNISAAEVRRWARDGRFLPPIMLGPRSPRWLESEVDDWITHFRRPH